VLLATWVHMRVSRQGMGITAKNQTDLAALSR
jgi:hypothetical protein